MKSCMMEPSPDVGRIAHRVQIAEDAVLVNEHNIGFAGGVVAR